MFALIDKPNKVLQIFDPIIRESTADPPNVYQLMNDSHAEKDLKRNEKSNLNLE